MNGHRLEGFSTNDFGCLASEFYTVEARFSVPQYNGSFGTAKFKIGPGRINHPNLSPKLPRILDNPA